MLFYEQLKSIRKQRGFTIREVAGRSGVSAAYISQLENGQRGTPSPDILQKLSEGLESSYSNLMQIAGYLDTDPMGESTKQKPLNLRVILREHQVVLDGKVLSDQDVQWIERMLTAMFSR
jgi:transcriptional regulator with XRE-family HTH domain